MALLPFKTQYEYQFDPETDAEKNDGTVISVPDENYSIKEILERFTRGLPIDDQRRPVVYDDYDSDEDEDLDDDSDWDVHPDNELGHDLTDIDEAVSFVKDVEKRSKGVRLRGGDDSPSSV